MRCRAALRGRVLLALLAPGTMMAQSTEATGVLNAAWGDPVTVSSTPRLVWTLTDPVTGTSRPVELSASQVEAQGGIRQLDRRAVTISGATIRGLGAQAQLGTPPQLGSKPFAVIMCKFSDVAAEPTSIVQLQELFSSSYPNLDHYYRELSAGQMNLAGSTPHGWFVLPNPRSHYVTGGADLTALASDCTAAANATVDFSGYFGIAMQFNADLDGFAWGGSRFLTLDGVSKSWPMIWMPLWATQSSKHGGYAHEIGHALGWSHSSGGHGVSYDSKWDVMSDSYLWHYSGTGTSLPGHTIISNKNEAGWISGARTITVSAGQQATFMLEQAEFPVAGSNPLLAWVNIPGSTQRYSLEARRLLGYDDHLPGEAVIIHRVTSGNVATVVDPDANQNPNDAAAMWLTGEAFNSPEGISIAIGTRTAQGWEVTVTMPGATTMRQLTVNGTGIGSGTVMSNPAGITCTITAGVASGTCSSQFVDGTSVTLTPSATIGNFAGWSGDCSGGGNCAVLMDRNRTATARFHLESRQLDVTLTGTGGGSVISSPTGIDCRLSAGTVSGACSAEFGLGETVMLYQASTAGTFGGWSGACAGMAPCQVVLGDNRTVGASFNLGSHQLTVNGVGNGSGVVISSPAGINCTITDADGTGSCAAGFTAGTAVSLTATATQGDFTGWGGACSGTGVCQVTMSAVRSVTAGFSIATHQLTLGGGGTGTGSVVSSPTGINCNIAAGVLTGTCSAAFEEGTAVVLTATSANGEFSGWEGACSGLAGCQVVMDQPRAVAAEFQLRIHQLVVTGSGGGRVTSSPVGIDCNFVPGSSTGACSADFVEGTAVTLNASPTGGIFTGWSAACTGTSGCQVTMNGDRTVTAGFATGQEVINLLAQWLMTGTPVSTQLRGPIDQAGNGNGTIDIGDLAALVDRTPNAVLPASVRRLMGSGVRQ